MASYHGNQNQVLGGIPYVLHSLSCCIWTVIAIGMLVSRVGSVTIAVHVPVFRADPPESEPLLGGAGASWDSM